MHSVPSLELLTRPYATSLNGGCSCSYRLKHRLEKGDRREVCLDFSVILFGGKKVLFLMQMDICSHIGFSANDINSLHGICLDTLGSTYGAVGDFSVDELAYGATKFLDIQDDEDGILGFIPPHEKASVGGAHKELKDDPDDITTEVLTHDDNAKSVNPPCSSAPSLPKPLKLVSAMKGSREKCGVGPPPKLSVKWGPDVYDPVPTSVVSNRGARKHNGKKKSKKKGSRESKGKEKKQSRKKGGSGSSLNYYSEQKEEVIFASAMDFHLDYFCGSSFANRYGSSLHLSSVAEAT
ncbi:hypothetical protein L6452_24472 [Arctium lappa]|uniref:Uncharacterized protein n=1 Tax=Arctium lappa TaxID=4217 RepID=A0ACB9AB80_ARCLA|nr:hypothetical protein L6452_24472 [Arctium lappa]